MSLLTEAIDPLAIQGGVPIDSPGRSAFLLTFYSVKHHPLVKNHLHMKYVYVYIADTHRQQLAVRASFINSLKVLLVHNEDMAGCSMCTPTHLP